MRGVGVRAGDCGGGGVNARRFWSPAAPWEHRQGKKLEERSCVDVALLDA